MQVRCNEPRILVFELLSITVLRGYAILIKAQIANLRFFPKRGGKKQ